MGAYIESIMGAGSYKCRLPWMRRLRIIFTSKRPDAQGKGYRVVIGDNTYGAPTTETLASGKPLPCNGNNYNITVRGKKYLALLKDAGTVEVSNMGYDMIALIMSAELYRIEIQCGYESDDTLLTIAKGEVSFISQKIHSRHDTTTYISYASEFVAGFTQARMNFNFNSGVNVAAMINYLMNEQGCYNLYISPKLRDSVVSYATQVRGKAADCITEALSSAGGSYSVMTDSSYSGNVISLTDISEKRVIKLNKDLISIQNGNPTVSSEGLAITVYPVIALVPGDIICVDPAFIDTSRGTESTEGAQRTFNSNFLDPNGCYIIQTLSYEIQNRGESFEYNISALALDRYKSITGLS